MSRKSPEPRTTQDIAQVAEKAGLRIRGLQNRLAECGPASPGRDIEEDLDRELQQYFAAPTGGQVSNPQGQGQIRSRVIEGVVERIMQRWDEDSAAAPIEDEIILRLADRILARLRG